MRKALVTGATGFIGRHVVTELTNRGFSVTQLAGSKSSSSIHVDLREEGAARPYLKNVEIVVHLAARAGGVGFQRDPDSSVFFDNCVITNNVLKDSATSGVNRFFLASSAVVYRPSTSIVTESDPLIDPSRNPSPYAWSKITDEVVASWFNAFTDMGVVAGRLANVYGPGGDASDETGTVVHALVRRSLEAKKGAQKSFLVFGHPKTVRSFIFVEDAAAAIAEVAISGTRGAAYNIDSGRPTTLEELANKIRLVTDTSALPEFRFTDDEHPTFRVSSTELIRGTGWRPKVDLYRGLKRTSEHVERSING